MHGLRFVLIAFLFTAMGGVSCSDSGSAGPDGAVDASLPELEPLEPDPAFDEDFQGAGPEATVTTLFQVLRPRFDPSSSFVDRWGRLRVPPEEIGRDYPQPGEPHLPRDELNAGGTVDATDRKSLLYLVQLSDAQLVDTQSPAYVHSNKGTNIGLELPAYHLAAPLFSHLLDAQIRTAAQFSLTRSFDFFIHTGDAVENNQSNELQWFIGILDGGTINADSAQPDDPRPGPDNDPYDPFIAAGVPDGIPWYAAVGNHDLMVNGNFPAKLVEEVHHPDYWDRITAMLGEFGLTLPSVPTSDQAPSILPMEMDPALTGSADQFDPSQAPTMEQIQALEGGQIQADPTRATMDPCQFIEQHFTGQTPDGHGFTQQSRTSCNGWYVTDPVPTLPFRLIVLDTGPHIGGVKGSITPPLNPDGSIDQARVGDPAHDQWAFLVQELDRAVTDGKAVILASHHSASDVTLGNSLGAVGLLLFPDDPDIQQLWEQYLVEPENSYGGGDLRDLITSYPNVILHLVGHTHRNRVAAVCPDGSEISTKEAELEAKACPTPPPDRTAANGYWEVMAGSSAKYPHQFRIIEVTDNRDGTGSIYVTSVNPQGGPRSLALYGRLLALADEQLSGDDSMGGSGMLWDRNVELRFQWAPSVQPQIDQTAAPENIESLTTLATPQPGLPTLPIWP